MKLLVVQCAALGHTLTLTYPDLTQKTGLSFKPIEPVFPAVTCAAAATMRTATLPAQHGIIANGRYDRASCKVEFWLQSARLCKGERIWQHNPDCKTAMIFHQQNLGEVADITLSPAPVHKHHGGMIQACQTKPEDLEKRLNDHIKRKFNLMNYWGPFANEKSSDWIVRATIDIMENDAPDLLMSYIPHLDYVLLKHGPSHSSVLEREVATFSELLATLVGAAKSLGYEVVVWGDYAITKVNTPIYINKILKEAGLFKVRTVDGGLTYPNLYESKVVAMADHQIAHIYLQDPSVLEQTRSIIQDMDGVDFVKTKQELGMDTPEAGELIALAKPNAWFTYRWWDTKKEAPDYATHVDIHSKIGFDTCELFFGFPPIVTTSMDPTKPQGCHGRNDEPAAFAVTDGIAQLRDAKSHLELSKAIKNLI